MKNMAVIDKGGIVTNIIVCADDFPEIPNKRIDGYESGILLI